MFDAREVAALAYDLEKGSREAVAEAASVVARGALNIKRDAARRISGHPRLRALPSAITYDTFTSLRGPAAEIGPDHGRRQGQLGHVAEFGTPTSAPMPYMGPAGEAERPRFERALEDLAVKAIGL